MAHIGVLKVLEKAGIPVDIITGTSMGSIIGGLYAIGYNAHSLDSMVRVQDWSYVITDKEDLRRQSLNDLKKQNTYFFTTGMTIGRRDPHAGGFIKGKNLAELFQQLCAGYTDSLNFTRDLRIPFACVATDIIGNNEVVFHSGRLPQAMRASMAIPAAFSPVRIADKVLVDGGLKNNYPADIARQMGADIIIGVTVQGPPKVAEDMGGAMSIICRPSVCRRHAAGPAAHRQQQFHHAAHRRRPTVSQSAPTLRPSYPARHSGRQLLQHHVRPCRSHHRLQQSHKEAIPLPQHRIPILKKRCHTKDKW
jgi:predicted acylesterase/phospholipase RssA